MTTPAASCQVRGAVLAKPWWNVRELMTGWDLDRLHMPVLDRLSEMLPGVNMLGALTSADEMFARFFVTLHKTIGICAGQPGQDYGLDRLGPSTSITRLHWMSRGPDRIDPLQQLLRHR